jgi:predicted acetyltransferase
MLVTDVEIRPVGPDDDMDAQADLSERAFGKMSPSEREEFKSANIGRVRAGAFLGAFVDGRPAGAANYHDMRQWWHGRAVPMAGVAGVKMSPEYRGRGIGRRMMTQLLGQIADRGYPLAALYPATMRIYRSLGWELAGSRYWTTIPARELRSLLAPEAGVSSGPDLNARELAAAVNAVDIRRAVPADAEAVIAIAGRAHEAARDNGPLTRDADSVAKWLERDGLYAYIAGDGFVSYHWSDDGEGLVVDYFHAVSPITSRALWSVLASHSSTARTVTARLAPQDPLWWLTRERDVAVARRSMWMLRVVDAPAAIAARGFPAAVSVSVPVVLKDPVRRGNDGVWELTISGGKGSLTANGQVGAGGPAGGAGGADGLFTLGARGLAALYGGTPVASLRMAGLVSGGATEADAALDAAFGGPAFMLDDF